MDQFKDLLQKFVNEESLTKEELQLFLQLAREPENEEAVKNSISQSLEAESFEDLSEGLNAELQFQKTLQRVKTTPRISVWKWATAAAAILLTITTSVYFLLPKKSPVTNITATTDIQPGKKGAILTLSNGTQVTLDSLGNGIVATQNGAKVVIRNGQLSYDPTGEITGEMEYNRMSTPKGRQFDDITLPDGTHVWLNAASSIRFPTAFKGKERRVEITGEVYFEVVKNKALPFIVAIKDQVEVEALGTRFNINAYENEAGIHTTLLEGSVKVAQHNQAVILKPGQQAQINTNIKVLEDADTEKAIAWKNGLFNFENASLEEVMRQLARWYDIEVVYEKGIPDIHFLGKLSRDITLTGLIRTLKASGVNFRIEEGRKLIVYP